MDKKEILGILAEAIKNGLLDNCEDFFKNFSNPTLKYSYSRMNAAGLALEDSQKQLPCELKISGSFDSWEKTKNKMKKDQKLHLTNLRDLFKHVNEYYTMDNEMVDYALWGTTYSIIAYLAKWNQNVEAEKDKLEKENKSSFSISRNRIILEDTLRDFLGKSGYESCTKGSAPAMLISLKNTLRDPVAQKLCDTARIARNTQEHIMDHYEIEDNEKKVDLIKNCKEAVIPAFQGAVMSLIKAIKVSEENQRYKEEILKELKDIKENNFLRQEDKVDILKESEKQSEKIRIEINGLSDQIKVLSEKITNLSVQPTRIDTSVNTLITPTFSSSSIKNIADLKVGEIAKKHLIKVLQNKTSHEELKMLQDPRYSKQIFGLNFPLLCSERRIISGLHRYYAQAIDINGQKFYVCSQWYANQKNKLLKWIEAKSVYTDLLTEQFTSAGASHPIEEDDWPFKKNRTGTTQCCEAKGQFLDDYILASIRSTFYHKKKVFWANIDPDLVEHEWFIVLNNYEKRIFYIFRIPAKEFKKSLSKIRKDNGKIDLNITLDNFTDVVSQHDFTPHKINEIHYTEEDIRNYDDFLDN